jgi:hypothetical protein
MGRLTVQVQAEGHALVAYGYSGQRIEIPSSQIGSVRTVRAYRTRHRIWGPALVVCDDHDRMLLRAAGSWDTYGEVERVCRAAGAPLPYHVVNPRYAARLGSMSASERRQARRKRRKRNLPLYQKAPGYRRLRTVPRGTTLLVLLAIVAFVAIVALCALAGSLPAALAPDWIGSVRVLIGIVGVALGIAGGIWLFATLGHIAIDGARWLAASLRAMTPAPPGRFFHRREASGRWASAVTAGLLALVPALIGWGPGVAIASGVHGVSDSGLVAGLRASGIRTQGFLIDVPDYSTQSNGDVEVTNVPTLSFVVGRVKWRDVDPSIGGRPLPLDSADPVDTRRPVTVVYDPSDLYSAAALPQITGSVWHGAPTANVIVGIVFTLALPVLILYDIFRLRRRRWLRNTGMLDDFFKV